MTAATRQTRQTRAISKAVRSAVGAPNSPYPIEITEGNQSPTLTGNGPYWVTSLATMRRVEYPSAYNRVALSSPAVYIHSTRGIVVGREWLYRHYPQIEGERPIRVKTTPEGVY